MQSKNAIGNLNNRYKAVLKKCALINIFGALAVATALLLTPIMAENAFAVKVESTGGNGGNGGGETDRTGTPGSAGTSSGAGAIAGVGGKGGDTGSVSGDIGEDAGSAKGGAGGGDVNADGGGGGGGGGASATASNNLLTSGNYGGEAISRGGNGGAGGNSTGYSGFTGASGGDGGNALSTAERNTLTLSSDVTNAYGGSATSTGGSGGSGGSSATSAPASGGNGGVASAIANENTLNLNTNTVDFAYGGSATSTGGSGGSGGVGGNGGDATTTANSNTVNITHGTINNKVYGGFSESNGRDGQHIAAKGGSASSTASSNKVNITVGDIKGETYGGSATSTAGSNFETLSGYAPGTDGGNAFAYTNSNEIELSSGTFTGAVYGGYATSKASQGSSGTYSPNSTSSGYNGGNGGSATTTASNNTLKIANRTTINNQIYGGFAESNSSNGGNGGRGGNDSSSYNRNNNGGNGGNGGNATATANSNTVEINGGEVHGSVYGGYAKSVAGNGGTGGVAGTESHGGTPSAGADGVNGVATAKASENKINIGLLANASLSTVGGHVIGGVAIASNSARAENNIVTLGGDINFAHSSTMIVGGLVEDPTAAGFNFNPNDHAFDGNTLNFNKFVNSGSIATIGNFDKYNFILSASTAAGSTALTVTDLYLGNGSGAAATKLASIGTVSIESGHNLPLNSTVILIDSTNAIDGTIANNGQTVTSDATTFTQQEWEINQDNTNHDITATFISEKLAPTSGSSQTKAEIVANSHTGSSTAILANGSYTVVNIAIPTAQLTTQNAAQGGSSETVGSLENNGMSAGSASSNVRSTWAPFAVIHGGYNSFDSDVDTDVTSLSFVGGLAHTSYFNASELLIGAFIETGTGSYNTSAGSIDSDGNLNYFGGGLFARYELYTQNGSPYIEASARLGNLNTDFDSDDIIDTTTGSSVNYETNSMYYGMHIGAGYIWNINEEWNLDMSAKYFWTHQESIDKEIAGDNFNFDAIDSHIVRVGATVNYEMLNNERFTFAPYAGLHYEHEFDSEARASVENISIPNSASLEGGTTVLSLGATFAHINGFSLNAKVEGSLGERDGVNGMVEMKYTF